VACHGRPWKRTNKQTNKGLDVNFIYSKEAQCQASAAMSMRSADISRKVMTKRRQGIGSVRRVISQKNADLEQKGDQDMYNIAGTDAVFLVIVDFVLMNDPESVRTAVEWQPCSCCHSNQTGLPIVI
jgi:hypothetical protein